MTAPLPTPQTVPARGASGLCVAGAMPGWSGVIPSPRDHSSARRGLCDDAAGMQRRSPGFADLARRPCDNVSARLRPDNEKIRADAHFNRLQTFR